jgi:hypothetical protein
MLGEVAEDHGRLVHVAYANRAHRYGTQSEHDAFVREAFVDGGRIRQSCRSLHLGHQAQSLAVTRLYTNT